MIIVKGIVGMNDMDIGIIGGADAPTAIYVTSFFYGWLNLGSLILGLVAWALPVINLVKSNKMENKMWVAFSVASVIVCAVSLCLQIFYQNYLVRKEDWAALMDTSNAVALVSSVLLVGTLALNIATLVVYRKNKHTGHI